jgi:Fe2+ transport system protein FeoA
MRRRWGFQRGRDGLTTGGNPDLIGSPRRAELLSGRLTLRRAPAGQELCVTSLGEESGHAQRLRELGMFEGQHVRVLSAGNPLICQVGDCRFGMCRRLADCILVEPVVQRTAQSA